MSLQTFTANVDRGYFKQAEQWKDDRGNKISPLQYLAEDLKQQHGVYPEHRDLDQATEHWLREFQVKPWEAHRHEKIREWAEQNWMIEKLFEDSGCPVRGDLSPDVQKAFESSTTQVLFPFFYASNIVAGILATSVLPALIAESIAINSHTADHLEMTDVAGDRSMGLTGEGATFVQLTVKSTNRPVTLKKFGALLNVTYEALRLVRLPLLARFLQRVGIQYQNDLTDFAIETLIAGDTAGAGAATTKATAVSASPTYADLVALELNFTQGYRPTTIVAPKEVFAKLLAFPVFTDPLAGVLHQTRGTYPTPLGMNLVRWDYTGKATSYATTKIIMLDPSIAMVQYTEGGILQESDRIIDGQWESSSISNWCGFGIMDRAATQVGTGWS